MNNLFKKLSLGLILPILFFVGCSDISTPAHESEKEPSFLSPKISGVETTSVPAEGTSSTLDFATWNLEWFGDPDNGPSDEQLQLENVQFIISNLDMDLWSVQEVTGANHFDNLVSQLSGYEGFLANDESVENGPEYYSDFDDNELKVGLIYKSNMTTLSGAKVILTDYDYEFAGRPPVEVQLSTEIDGDTQNFIVVLLHAKAGSGQDDWERRNAASQALKSYLDSNWSAANVMVIGDFNDDVDESITRPKDSPYQNFVDDAQEYIFPTKVLSDNGESSTVYYSDMIDHHLGSNELMSIYEDGSVQVFPADNYIEDYDQTTSDHYPVLSNFQFTDGGNTSPSASFTYSCAELTCDFDGTGSTDSDGTIEDYQWDFGDGNSASGSNVSHTYGSEDTYTVTLTVTDDGGATDDSSENITVGSSNEEITLSASGYKEQGLQKADLSWSGATSTNVDIYRDGSIITTTANDGEHTDHIDQRGGGSYTYQLCEEGTTTCSNEQVVSF